MAETGLSRCASVNLRGRALNQSPGNMFEWLDEAIAILGKAGLKVVLGTQRPPKVDDDRHPDMLAVDKEGRTRKFGSRRHYCFSHEGYKSECAIMWSNLQNGMAHPDVAAWQTDNEYGCHDTTISYSPAARVAFKMRAL